ncbi:cytochrome c oxidase subunit 3 [Halobaculum litoreum]|uniref:Heme-copper oxidase subunit III n=1 Tax=Halobaculum litoreum TaxID=3031998 RepID=A0ABD5XSM7_9EURY|nr:heme-copper oxidase subunit III [Halobaculum sp. DT92]
MDATDAAGAEHDAGAHTSRWPIVAAGGAAALYVGAGVAMAGGDALPSTPPLVVAALGLAVLVGGLAGWTREAFLGGGAHTTHGEKRSRLYVGGMWLFLLSDLATFAAGFVYYAFVRSGTWPPSELPPLLGSLVLANTAILLASSVTVHFAHDALEAGERQRFLGLLGGTVLLGAVFLVGQAYEYYEFITAESFTLSDGVYASAFYGLTGLHGLHVTLGVVMLAILFVRALRGGYAAGGDTSVRTVSLYWHFVDAVWVFLVAVLYVGAVVG